MSILQIVDLKKDYGEEPNITHALKGIQFEVDKGEFVGIMGASGSGKTTLLNCISTIDTATDGHIYLDGKDILEIREKDIARFRRESLGFIFQDFNLLDTLTIEENIALALTINKVSANKIDSQIQQIAAKLNITDILNKYPSLSKNPIIKQRNSRPRLQKSKNISQKLASKGVSTPSLQAFSDSWQQI